MQNIPKDRSKIQRPWLRSQPVCSPCGPELPHYFCRQFGYCLFCCIPPALDKVDALDKANAIMMSVCTWLTFACAGLTAYMYSDDPAQLGEAVNPRWPFANNVFAIILIVNGVLSIFPGYYSITISNIFKAKVFANGVWSVPLVMAAVAFFHKTGGVGSDLQGHCFLEFGLGWSVCMFVCTGAREQKLLCYPAGVAFTAIGLALPFSTKEFVALRVPMLDVTIILQAK